MLSTNQLTALIFTSSFYLSALLVQYPASITTSNFGRRFSIAIGATTYLLLRGSLNTLIQLMITIGIFLANLINYNTNKIKGGWGWRLSLGLAAVSAAIVILRSLYLPDTPNSMIERSKSEEDMKKNLQRLRGTNNILEEYHDLGEACANASKAKNNNNNYYALIFQRKYRPQMVMAFLIPFFQQLTGINVIIFYALVLFQTLGFGDNAYLMSMVTIGSVNVLGSVVAIALVDRAGRRVLFTKWGGSDAHISGYHSHLEGVRSNLRRGKRSKSAFT
ncbi:hypothetical protein Sjap_003220 [Stephania japonica]|uniref:Major facilitator superfamily (MFS) profile domain-containing protein n=1 Tax=Stephania japonica TaxID=461633 RepID=A0AAP0PUV2_9MAGN